jgi:hypothetical protein
LEDISCRMGMEIGMPWLFTLLARFFFSISFCCSRVVLLMFLKVLYRWGRGLYFLELLVRGGMLVYKYCSRGKGNV